VKTIHRRKHMMITLRPADDWDYALAQHDHPDDPCPPYWMEHHERVICVGDDDVGIVSWLECQDQIIVTQLYVYPEHRNNMIGSYILGILANNGKQCRVLCTPTSMPFYQKNGFFQDHGHILVTKELNDDPSNF
jgi:GNAT superfamily N-acetyltransferase